MWDRIKLMFASIWAYVLPLLKALSSTVGKIVLNEAIKVCSEIATSMLTATGPEKKAAAAKAVVKSLKSKGYADISDAIINAAIETAVQYIKSKE